MTPQQIRTELRYINRRLAKSLCIDTKYRRRQRHKTIQATIEHLQRIEKAILAAYPLKRGPKQGGKP